MKTLLEIEKGDKLYVMSLNYFDNGNYPKAYCQEVFVRRVYKPSSFNESKNIIEIDIYFDEGVKNIKPYYVCMVIDKNNPELVAENLETAANAYEISYDKNAIEEKCSHNNEIIKESIIKKIKKLKEVLKEFE